MNTATLSIRTDPDLKSSVEKKLKRLGLNHSMAINIFYHAIEEYNGLPFEVKIPNAATKKAVHDVLERKNLKKFKTVDALFGDLEC